MAELVRYVNRSSTAGGDGTTNATVGANRAYVDLQEFVDQEATALNGDHIVVYCTGGTGLEDSDTTISGFTFNSVADYVLIKANTGQEALKTGIDSSRYKIDGTSDSLAIVVSDDNIRIDGIQITADGNGYCLNYSFVSSSNDLRLENCYFTRRTSSNSCRGLITQDADIDDMLINNNCFFDFYDCMFFDLGGSFLIYNNEIFGGTSDGIEFESGSPTATLKNNNFGNNGDDIDVGTGILTVQYNCADDDFNTEFGESTNQQPSGSDWDNEKEDVANGDFTALSGGNIEDNGIGPSSDSAVSTTDIEGDARSGTTCYIGCDEIVGSVSTSIPVIQHHRQTQGAI